MGNCNSNLTYPNIDIYYELSKYSFQVGETIDGIVHLNVKSNTSYWALNIQFKGSQLCRWIETSVDADGSLSTQRREKLHEICNNTFTLATFNGYLPMGHYSFPFAIATSPNFPASFQLKQDDDKGGIFYAVSAYLVNQHNKPSQQFIDQITLTRTLRIVQSQLVDTRVANPVICCCCSQGTTILTMTVFRNLVTSNTILPLKIEVDNRLCSRLINKVTVRFNRKYCFKPRSKKFASKLQNIQYTPPVGPGQYRVFQINLVVPFLDKPTFQGTIISQHYFIEAKARFDGSCYCKTGNLKVMAQVFVNAAPKAVKRNQIVQAPPNWNPTYAPKKSFRAFSKAEATNQRLAMMTY